MRKRNIISNNHYIKAQFLGIYKLAVFAFGLGTLSVFIGCDDALQNPKSSIKSNIDSSIDLAQKSSIDSSQPFDSAHLELDFALANVFQPPLEILGKNSTKPILLFFGTAFCQPCKAIAQNIAQSKPLQDTLKSNYQAYFIDITSKESIKIDSLFLAQKIHTADSKKIAQDAQIAQTTHKALALALGVRATPTLVFLDKNGKEFYRFVGGIEARHLAIALDFLKSTPTNANQQQISLELHNRFLAKNISPNPKNQN